MKHERIFGDPVAMLIAETWEEARADERRATFQPLSHRLCGWVAVAVFAYMALQLARAAARIWFGWELWS